MRRFFFGLIFFAGSQALATPENRTPLSCRYTNEVTGIAIKSDCGGVKVCGGKVICTFVDNQALQQEFGGDREKAKASAPSWSESGAPTVTTLVEGTKSLWSEITGKPPKFSLMESEAFCTTKQATCPSALTCILDKNVIDVEKVNANEINLKSLSSTTGGAQ